jgi:hypothetical protein
MPCKGIIINNQVIFWGRHEQIYWNSSVNKNEVWTWIGRKYNQFDGV